MFGTTEAGEIRTHDPYLDKVMLYGRIRSAENYPARGDWKLTADEMAEIDRQSKSS